MDPAPRYVRNPVELNALVEEILRHPRVAIDTEFISEGAYEPELCLVQAATPEGIWIVDPLAVPRLERFWQAVTDPDRELIALAAREEIRFCVRGGGGPPERLFDPQIAAGLIGYGYPLSHTNVVKRVLGVQVNGGESYTDWRRRPLSERQLDYAADDVRYLLQVQDAILEHARKSGRVEWIHDECRRLVERVLAGDLEERWRRVSGSAGLGKRELAVVRELWRWRDGLARSTNSTPRKLMRDELLVEIARRRPAGPEDLFELRGVDRGRYRKEAPEIIAAVRRAMELPASELPIILRRDDPPQVGPLSQLMAVVANSLAAGNEVDPALLATAADLQEVVRWRLGLIPADEEPFCLTGWRGEVLRKPLLGLLDGERALRVKNLKSPNPLQID